MAKDTKENSESMVSPVQPFESVKTEVKKGEPCWNCEGTLDKESVCDNCGFDRKLVYNLDLEALKTKERE